MEEQQIAEAAPENKLPQKRVQKNVWIKRGIMAACVCLAIGLGIFGIGRGAKPGDTAGSGGGGHEPGSVFMSYAGPVFPLNALSDTTGITAVRNIDFDFASYETKMKYYEVDGEQTGYQDYETESLVTDRYLLNNTTDEEQIDIASDEMLFGSMAELMYDYGILSDNVAERYEWGSLEDMWTETYNMQRVMYVNFDVVIPANGSVRVDATMRKDASFDFVGEDTDRNGYDMVTRLGSTLEFSEQTASVSNTQFIEIVYQNFGFDLENGITQVELDMNEPHYYMEVRKVN